VDNDAIRIGNNGSSTILVPNRGFLLVEAS